MNSTPKVSVLIPTYNYAHFLDETIQSVLDQTFTDFELIIVDNCSTDNTDEVVSKYLGNGRVSFYRNKINVGLVGNWNKCLDYARGTYIKYLCADDKFHPQILEKFVAVLDKHSNVSIVGCYTEIFGRNNRIRETPYQGLISGKLVREKFIKDGARNWLSAPSAVMFRRSGIDQVGRFNPQIFNRTDKELYLRLLAIGDCYVIPEALCYIRSHVSQQTSRVKKQKYEPPLEDYRYFACVKRASDAPNPLAPALNAHLKKSAKSCAVIMYKLIPKLYRKKSRLLFKEAFQISYTEGVLLAPLLYLFQWRYLKKYFRRNPNPGP